MRRQLLKITLTVMAGLCAASGLVAQEAPPPGPGQAEEIVNRMLAALGGDAFLQAREMTARGRIYDFNRGQLASPGERFVYYAKFPGKERIEFGKKGNIVYVNDNDQGWELDRQGIREESPEQVEDFQQSNRRDVQNLLRFRARKEKMQVYYVGREIADIRRVHVLELVDERGDSFKLWVDASNYLPLQLRYRVRDDLTREWVEVIEYYGKYVTVQGIATAMHLMRERGGLRSLEVYFSEVDYRTAVPEALFTRASLEERWAKVKK